MKRILCLIGLAAGLVSAQTQPPKGVSKKAYEHFLQAVRWVQVRQPERALPLLEEVVKAEPTYEEAWILKGKLHLQLEQFAQAREVGQRLRALRDRSAQGYAWGLYFLGKAYLAEMAFDSAQKVWGEFIHAAMGHLPGRYQEEGARLFSQAQSAARLVQEPVPFRPTNLGPQVNTPEEEYLPSLTADGQRLFFTSRRPRSERNPLEPSGDEDLYWTEKDPQTGTWNPAQPVGPPINSPHNEGAAFFSSDGQWAFITLCNRPDGLGSCDLYFSELKGLSWSEPRNLGAVVNSSAWESHPSLTHDRRRLYFASSRPGGLGGSDLWYTDFVNGAWQPPLNLGSPVNTPGDEYSPMIAADGRTLYFASDWHPGLGGQDLFVTYLTDTGWTRPRNLGYPLNTPGDEQTLCLDAKGKIGYIALVRPEGLGKHDIYAFPLWPAIRPRETATYVKGHVENAQTQAPLSAWIKIVDIQSRDTLRLLRSNAVTGEFLVSLPLGRRYAFFAEAPGYLFYSGHFDLSERDTAYQLTVRLERIRKGGRLLLRNIFFDFDKAELRPESEVELEQVVRLLKENPQWQVEVQGHTDSVGSAAYNQALSQRRAEAVRQFLLARGIEVRRVVAKGYGATQPVADNRTEAGRALNRRTEIVFIGAE